FLYDPEVWQTQGIYCLPCKDIKVLNNKSLNYVQHHQIQELFTLMKKDNSEVDFIHLNDGFSPLCLQALKTGFGQASTWVHDQCHGVLLHRLMTLNEIDAHKLNIIEDTNSGESLSMSDTDVSCGKAVVVVCDFVDTQGRIIEGLRCQEEVLRHHVSSYVRAAVSPCRVDVCGVLVDSEYLLSLSRVRSDDNTLGFHISQFINKYTTRNHQDISLETLPHTKLSEPFRLFTIDMYKLLGVPQPGTAAELSTVTKEASDECPEAHQQGQISACPSSRHRDCSLLAGPQRGHKHQLVDPEADTVSCTSAQNIGFAAEYALLVKSEDVCTTTSQLRAASSCEMERNLDCSKGQHILHQNDTSEILVSKHAKQEPVSEGMLAGVGDTKLVSECVGKREYTTQQFISKETLKTACLKGKAEGSRLSVLECDSVRNKKRSSNCQLVEQDGAVGGSSPDRKRGRLAVDGDEGSNAFLGNDVNEENGELAQSVHLKVPVIQSGQVTALVYWFDLHLSPSCCISTSDSSHHWNQAAVMSLPSQMQNVAAKDVLSLFCQMDGSAISFLIE
ncbi:unnamed protein product, partial [Candidula unifasciata]